MLPQKRPSSFEAGMLGKGMLKKIFRQKKCHQTEKLHVVTLSSLPKEKGLKTPCKSLSFSFKMLPTIMLRGAFYWQKGFRALTPVENSCLSCVSHIYLMQATPY